MTIADFIGNYLQYIRYSGKINALNCAFKQRKELKSMQHQ